MKKSHLIAVCFSGLIIVWMAFGMVFSGNPAKMDNAQTDKDNNAQAMTVEVSVQSSAPVISYIISQGHVMPDREVHVRSEVAAQVTEILIEEGQNVKAGDIIATLDIDDRQAKLDKAIAKTAEAQKKYNSLKSLNQKGYTSQTKKDEALATLRSAEADQKLMALEIENTKIKAPFDGIIDHQNIEEGDYVRVGDEAFTIVDNDPLIVTVHVPQHEIGALKINGMAAIKLATGQNKQGKIRFIAPRAEQTTRTFRVEVEIPNPDNLPSGISATALIPKKSITAHFISPALLALGEQGETGVKIVNDENVVEFYEVKIVKAEPSGVYVTGLPKQVKIISNGQGFVSAGEKVSFTLTDETNSNDTATQKSGKPNESH